MPDRPRFLQRTIDLSAIILLAGIVGGCAPRTGDFGRRSDDVVTASILPNLGLVGGSLLDEPVSLAPFTDEEIELRDRAWRFLQPAIDRSAFLGMLGQLRASRVLPSEASFGVPTTYHALLMGGRFRSVTSRYARLLQDMEADRLLIGPFSTVAARVCEADRLRERSLAHVRDLSEADIREARGRIAENGMVIDLVYLEWGHRVEGYRYALEHLLIQAPSREAVAAERELARLSKDWALIDSLAPCERLLPERWGSTDGVVLDRHRSRLRVNELPGDGHDVRIGPRLGDGRFKPAHPGPAGDPGGRVMVPK